MTLENATLANISFSDTQIKIKRGTAAEWTAANPVLAVGEPAFETDTGIMKIGDGVTAYNSLDYVGTESFSGSEIDTLLTTVNSSNISATHKITRSATIVIAASDSSAKGKAQADYVCDGTADNVEIQAALDALPATGGEIHFLDGTFQLAATVARAIDNVTLSGCGISTYIKYDNITACISVGVQAGWEIKDIRFDFGGVDISTGTKWSISNMWRDKRYEPITPVLIDKWSADNVAPASAGNFTGEYLNHPLIQISENFETETWTDTGTGATVTYDTDVYMTGTKSLKVVTAVGARSILRSPIIETYYQDVSNTSFGMWVRSPDISKLGSFVLYLKNTISVHAASTRSFVAAANDEWIFIVFSHFNITGEFNPAAVRYFEIYVNTTTGNSSTVYIDSIYYWKRCLTPKGAITFTFDDGDESVYELAKPAFDKYKYAGVGSLVLNSATPTRVEYAKELQNSGWDIVNHSYDHVVAHQSGDPETQYLLMQKWLAENGFKSGSRFAILYGGYNDAEIVRALNNNVLMTRSTSSGWNSLPAAGTLLVAQYAKSDVTVATLKTYIDAAVANGTWLNLIFHYITTGTPASEYEYTLSGLTELIEYCNTVGIEVITYSQAVDRIRSTSQHLTLSGTGTITNGTTSVNIRHGFHKAPTSIQITPTSSLGSAASIWVSSKDTGTGNLFTVSVNDNPGADVTFEWTAVL
ncbi:hypothetical protein DU52_15815 [Methanosarcina mazei]|uniref:NodB homology domain-containing protein n=1 Tax=Methanosarcina mazei TaxID=2209 RepID=A0A0F8GSN2_METMZ|nr:polysaccharide deacetylase family protein [Methanosarcina mazei]KKG35390.1 hypothetical protein DU52_15815 [Methanosarcina mazei]